jgi:hypothetical protein
MTQLKLTVCNRCGHRALEHEFEGMDVQIYDQDGTGSDADSYALCNPCTDALRVWLVSKPISEANRGQK